MSKWKFRFFFFFFCCLGFFGIDIIRKILRFGRLHVGFLECLQQKKRLMCLQCDQHSLWSSFIFSLLFWLKLDPYGLLQQLGHIYFPQNFVSNEFPSISLHCNSDFSLMSNTSFYLSSKKKWRFLKKYGLEDKIRLMDPKHRSCKVGQDHL